VAALSGQQQLAMQQPQLAAALSLSGPALGCWSFQKHCCCCLQGVLLQQNQAGE
jgi:hypothetical protein